jgi:hypothetical protein
MLLIAACALAWGVKVMHRYGLTYDEPALYYAGDRTYYALTHPTVENALDFFGQEPTKEQGFDPDFKIISPYANPKDPAHYPVLPALLCAATDRFFHVRHAWLTGLDAHHVGLVMMHAFALFWFGTYAMRVLGRRAGILAAIFLATFPCALGHSFNDPKDWTCADYYGVTMLAAATGILERRARPIVASGFWLGFALSCKFNAIFALVTVLLWTPIAYLAIYHRRRNVPSRLIVAYLTAPYVAAVFFFVAWPWLYHGHVNEWWAHLSDYVQDMANHGVVPDRSGWSTYPLRCAFFMTPPIVLGCAAFYVLAGLSRERKATATWALLLLWFAVPLYRTAAPHGYFYDANRHFIEYIPALSAMAGAGASLVVGLVGGLLARIGAPRALRFALAVAGALALGAWVLKPIREYHPFETTYFNVFAGGLGGAQQRGLLEEDEGLLYGADECEGDYWYTSLRDALERMEAEKGPLTHLALHGPPHSPQALGDWTLDRKITFDEKEDAKGATMMYVAPANGFRWKDVHKLEKERPLLFQVKRGGGLIYEVLGPRDGQAHELATPLTIYDTPLAERPNAHAIWKR